VPFRGNIIRGKVAQGTDIVPKKYIEHFRRTQGDTHYLVDIQFLFHMCLRRVDNIHKCIGRKPGS
jgi:hypothetical protein